VVDDGTAQHLFVTIPLQVGVTRVTGMLQMLLQDDVVARMTSKDDVQ